MNTPRIIKKARTIYTVLMWAFFISIELPVFAQDSLFIYPADSIIFEADPILVTATRISAVQTEKPFAVSVADITHLQNSRQLLSLQESLTGFPGILAMNAQNFAQDLRLSIRGFGARAAFGIRGIKILMDGIPLTTPDGQTQMDNLDLSLISHVEIMRGPASAMHGNASGGIINLSMKKPAAFSGTEFRLAGGSYGYAGMQAKTSFQSGSTGYLLSAALNQTDGYRRHSNMHNYLFNGQVYLHPDSLSTLAIRLAMESSPKADDPGALTHEQAKSDPTRANPGNLQYNAGESVNQGRFGLNYERTIDRNRMLRATGYFTHRTFDNRLPFTDGGVVNLTRNYGGGEADFYLKSDIAKFESELVTGFSVAHQADRRKRYDNLDGSSGSMVFDQDELYSNLGIFIEQELHRADIGSLNLSLRYDMVVIRAHDYYLSDGDASGERSMNGFSGSAGMIFPINQIFHVYGNVSTGFETPALVELSANPEGEGGLNPDLDPQRTVNYETGIKASFFDRVYLETALFFITVNDELIPYELPDTPGRTYYHNAGRSDRKGIEVALNASLFSGFILGTNYTYSDFRFRDFLSGQDNYAGNTIPGVPRHMLNLSLTVIGHAGFFGRLELNSRSRIYTNDANSAYADPSVVTNISGGYRFSLEKWHVEPFLGINNLADSRYFDNIRINAFGGRYFEPAPGRHFYAGVTIQR